MEREITHGRDHRPIRVGDAVRIVHPRHVYTGLVGRVTKIRQVDGQQARVTLTARLPLVSLPYTTELVAHSVVRTGML